LKTGWIFNAPTLFFSRRQCLKTRSNFKHVVFYIVILCLNRNNRIGRNKFSDILGTFEIILIICIIYPLTYKLNQRKPAIVPALSLLFICADVEAKNKVTISEETHLNNFLWIRDHGRDQEWHVVKLRQALLIKTQIVEIWITA
jgi:hypothetical protein